MPEWSNGQDLRSCGLVPAQVRILSPSIKMLKKREKILLLVPILILFLLSYNFLDGALTNFLSSDENVFVDRVIDGDTVQVNGTSVRLLGVNTPEKGEFYYEEAKNFTTSMVLGKNVTLKFEKDRYDKYHRILAYVFLGDKNVNAELVRNGFANYYFYSGKDSHSSGLIEAWNTCLNKNVGLCEKSADLCGNCFSINSQLKIITNKCPFSCNITGWDIETEGRERFFWNNTVLVGGANARFELNFTESGGSVYLRDIDGKLVAWSPN